MSPGALGQINVTEYPHPGHGAGSGTQAGRFPVEISWQGIRLGRGRERRATVKKEQDVNQCGKYDKKQLRLHSNTFSLPRGSWVPQGS